MGTGAVPTILPRWHSDQNSLPFPPSVNTLSASAPAREWREGRASSPTWRNDSLGNCGGRV
ncbi:hypothetical protein JZ751_016809 [Albula glossodonta]|uniref:Uncharacterized protein n=1 Tax=Albula glossodonta TaxID=121402 RepID=A0A8T2P0X9_9TELE|nr:hypothetical protein JZ751_016809 [Albula glossodonta]